MSGLVRAAQNEVGGFLVMQKKLKILWLKSGPLHPVDTGGKIRTYNMLRELMKLHEIDYLALFPEGLGESARQEANEYSHAQHWIPWRETPKRTPGFYAELLANFLFSDLPYALGKYQSPAMARLIGELDRAGNYDLIVSDFLLPAVSLFPTAQHRLVTKSLLFQHNVEAQIWQRMCENAVNPLKKYYLRGQWERMAAFERQAASRFDSVVGVSEEDCQLMRQRYGLRNVAGSVPTGVDTDYFRPATAPAKKNAIVFLGSMDWLPNIDGLEFFRREIYPAIKRRVPEVSLVVVGRNPPASVRNWERADASVKVTGTVPDVRPYLAAAELMVVPLRVGGGTRIKIYEAMAAGVPVISTRIGAEGLAVKGGEHIALADSPEEFANATVELLQQPEQRRQLAGAGCQVVRDNFSWRAVTAIFSGYCTRLCQPTGEDKN